MVYFDVLIEKINTESIQKVNKEIDAICSLIQKNYRLQEIIFGKDDTIRKELQKRGESQLMQPFPSKDDWRRYRHCSVVTRLYAIYENFVEELVSLWLQNLPNLILSYSELNEKIKNNHRTGVGKVLQNCDKQKYNHLLLKDIARDFYYGIANSTESEENQYSLLPEAFLVDREQNLRKEELEKLLAKIDIQKCWTWIEKHEDIREQPNKVEDKVEDELKQWIQYRNDAAHSMVQNTLLNKDDLLHLATFAKALCKSLADLFTYHRILLMEEKNKIKNIGKISEWFNSNKAAIAKVKNTELSVGLNVFLISSGNQETSICKLTKIDSIQIEGESKNEIKVDEEQEIGLKFDIEAKVGWQIYSVC